jgi:hypothetical protein
VTQGEPHVAVGWGELANPNNACELTAPFKIRRVTAHAGATSIFLYLLSDLSKLAFIHFYKNFVKQFYLKK